MKNLLYMLSFVILLVSCQKEEDITLTDDHSGTWTVGILTIEQDENNSHNGILYSLPVVAQGLSIWTKGTYEDTMKTLFPSWYRTSYTTINQNTWEVGANENTLIITRNQIDVLLQSNFTSSDELSITFEQELHAKYHDTVFVAYAQELGKNYGKQLAIIANDASTYDEGYTTGYHLAFAQNYHKTYTNSDFDFYKVFFSAYKDTFTAFYLTNSTSDFSTGYTAGFTVGMQDGTEMATNNLSLSSKSYRFVYHLSK